MGYRAISPGRDRTAIGISIAIHCCAVGVLLTIPRPTFTPDVADERTIVTSIIRIEHRPPPKAARRTVAAAPMPRPPAPLPRPPIHVARTEAHAARALVVASERRFVSHSIAVKRDRAAVAPGAPARDVSASRSSGATVVATPTPTAAPSATPAVVAREDGIGNFGEDYPAKVDPQSRGGLFAGITETVQLKVSVDESGRAIAIEFVRAPADPATLQELRARLMAARFIPAVCNGLRCAGTVPLHN